MARVSYQPILGSARGGPGREGRYVPLGREAIGTRRKDARARIEVQVSKAQRRWLREVEEVSGEGVDAQAVVRALIDLGMELPVDWALVAGGRALRDAVRESVLVREAPDRDDAGAARGDA